MCGQGVLEGSEGVESTFSEYIKISFGTAMSDWYILYVFLSPSPPAYPKVKGSSSSQMFKFSTS